MGPTFRFGFKNNQREMSYMGLTFSSQTTRIVD